MSDAKGDGGYYVFDFFFVFWVGVVLNAGHQRERDTTPR